MDIAALPAKIFGDIENKFSIPGFFERLVTDDDWSTIIKLNALLETAYSHLIAEELQKPELLKICSLLPMGDKSTGKIAFLEALKLIDSEDRSFLQALGKLRNKVAHDVSNTRFSLLAHINSLDKNQFQSFLEAMLGKRMLKGRQEEMRDYTREDPRKAVFLGACAVLTGIFVRTEKLRKHKQKQKQGTPAQSPESPPIA